MAAPDMARQQQRRLASQLGALNGGFLGGQRIAQIPSPPSFGTMAEKAFMREGAHLGYSDYAKKLTFYRGTELVTVTKAEAIKEPLDELRIDVAKWLNS